MSSPKVSIVIPVYNVENFLEQCMDSAIQQTLEDIEIICIDDGSTDKSGEILDAYVRQDSRVRVIHKENGGYGVAMNTGLDLARGEYFSILESDDFFMPDTCEMLYKNAKKFDADIVRSDYFDYITKYGKVNLTAKQMSKDYSYYYRLICPNKEPEVYTFVMHNWTGIYKMSFLRDKNIRYNETPGASYQDNGFYFQVFSQTERLVYIPRPFYCYRIDNPGSSINNPDKVYTMAEEYAFIRAFLAKHPEFEQTLLPVYYARLFRAYHQTYMRIAPKFRKEFRQFFHDQFVEAEQMHLLDTGLCSVNQRKLLCALLKSPDEYHNLIFGNKLFTARNINRALEVIEVHGWKAFFGKCRKVLGRRRGHE
ncbi:glycosyltransferase family 2 protein [Enterocloster citroniae]|uniref:Glycosyltransferase involved in cell wall biosynthesis n=2 Tax=Enterocloster citroniae TaxID=358743 RepID=A0ABV2FXE1_9FIRM|nr:glycosyltransferase [Enterocloster citroniae]KMW22049.1 hypothetical protein HMPREF9470_00123 [[Clostridium] citroniae WAL-19142]